MKPLTACALTLCALNALIGCGGAQSTYTPKQQRPGALTWSYEGGDLLVMKGGESVGHRGSWSDLDAAVGCVPEALALAESASTSGHLATAFEVGALVSLLGGAAYGINGVLDDDSDNDVDALVVMGAGLVTGLVLTALAIDQEGSSLRDAVDAVNVYTDQHTSTAACLSRGPLE